jgi:hypothetical protein
MKSLVYSIMVVSVVTLALSIVTKYTYGMTTRPGMVAGIGPTGYLTVTVVLLLIGANLALLELLKKK